MRKGKFITFEGGEGTGKSTQINLLTAYLQQKNINVLKTREPGGSGGAEKIRELLVKGEPEQWDPLTEALLFLAARRDHVEKLIKPALNKGQWVLCDRFQLSTLVYSGYGHGIEKAKLDRLYELIIGSFQPDKVFIFSLDPLEGLRRASSRGGNENRIERKGLEFHQRVHRGYQELASTNSNLYSLIDAAASINEVHMNLVKRLEPSLEKYS